MLICHQYTYFATRKTANTLRPGTEPKSRGNFWPLCVHLVILDVQLCLDGLISHPLERLTRRSSEYPNLFRIRKKQDAA